MNLNSFIKAAPTNKRPGPEINLPIAPNIPLITLLPFSGSKALTRASEIELKMVKRFFTAGEATIPPMAAASCFTLAIDFIINADMVLSNSALRRVASSVAPAD